MVRKQYCTHCAACLAHHIEVPAHSRCSMNTHNSCSHNYQPLVIINQPLPRVPLGEGTRPILTLTTARAGGTIISAHVGGGKRGPSQRPWKDSASPRLGQSSSPCGLGQLPPLSGPHSSRAGLCSSESQPACRAQGVARSPCGCIKGRKSRKHPLSRNPLTLPVCPSS